MNAGIHGANLTEKIQSKNGMNQTEPCQAPVQSFVSTSQLSFWDIGEQKLESMLEQGHKIMRQAIETYKPVAIFAGWSGGDDSVVAAHFACGEYGAAAVHTNTLINMDKAISHVRSYADKKNWQLLEYQAIPEGPPEKHRKGPSAGKPFDQKTLPTGRWIDGQTAYEEFSFNFGLPGPGMHSRMYQRLKFRGFQHFKREAKRGHHRESHVIFVTGIRHDESKIRAGYKRAIQKDGGSIWVNPFYWNSAFDFENYRQEFGLARNPVKGLIGISGDCLCGSNKGDREELEPIGIVEPQKKIYINDIESRCQSLGLPCQYGVAPPKTKKNNRLNMMQMELFEDPPEVQPACHNCIRKIRSC